MEYAWIDAGNGRSVYRPIRQPVGARSDLATPQLIRQFASPVQSMANGKFYDNPRDLAASHRASGNPHGIDFIELGNEEQKFVPYEASRKERRDDIRQAKAYFEAGWRPEIVALD